MAQSVRGHGGRRTFQDEICFIHELKNQNTKMLWEINKGFVPNMNVPGKFFVNDKLEKLMFDELRDHCARGNHFGGFLPAVKQIANVAALPGIVKHSIAMPDVHAGYGFAIGNVAACMLSYVCDYFASTYKIIEHYFFLQCFRFSFLNILAQNSAFFFLLFRFCPISIALNVFIYYATLSVFVFRLF